MEIDPLLMRGSLVTTMVMISPSRREVSPAEQLDGRKAIECRWILKGRQTMMVSVTIEKARLVVKMFFDKFKELTTMRLCHP